MEACGHDPWFERLLAELGIELWLGDAARIRAAEVRRQKTDRRDAEHLQVLLREDRFPRIWVPSLEERDVRQLLVHRHKQVQPRTRTKNQLHALALSQGVQRKRKLWSEAGRAELEQLELLPYAAIRRQRLLATLDQLEAEIAALHRQVKVAVARKLATRLYLRLREDWDYAQLCRAVVQASPSHSVAARQKPSA